MEARARGKGRVFYVLNDCPQCDASLNFISDVIFPDPGWGNAKAQSKNHKKKILASIGHRAFPWSWSCGSHDGAGKHRVIGDVIFPHALKQHLGPWLNLRQTQNQIIFIE